MMHRTLGSLALALTLAAPTSAQVFPGRTEGVPTLLESQILELFGLCDAETWDVSDTVRDSLQLDPGCFTTKLRPLLERYLREGCKLALDGWWMIDGNGSVIRVFYDETNKVFLGSLARRVRVAHIQEGAVVFKAYFPRQLTEQIDTQEIRTNTGLVLARPDLFRLRQMGACPQLTLTGVELGADVRSGEKRETALTLTLDEGRLAWHTRDDSHVLTRQPSLSVP